MIEIPNFFKPFQKESTPKKLEPGESECKKTFEFTGIVEKIEKLRDSKILKYSETEGVVEPAHVKYYQDGIGIIFDHYKYEQRNGPIEIFKEILTVKNGSYFRLEYRDSMKDDKDIFNSNNSKEILEKINETVVKINGNKK